VKLDLLDALAEFADLRFLRIVQKNILRCGVVQIDLADERALCVVKVTALRLNNPPGFARVFLLPFRDDVIVGLNFKKPLEDERETLRGRLLECEDFYVIIV